MTKNLYKSITGTTNPLAISVDSSHGNAVAVATFRAEGTTLDIGDEIEIDMGFDTDHSKIFTGYVKQVERSVPDDTYVITAQDILVRAVDYFIASVNPENPFTRSKISAEDFIEDLLALAGLTNYTGDTSNFIYAWTKAAEINLVGCYDQCKQMADMIAWHLYSDVDGNIFFKDRKPFVMGGDTPIYTLTDEQIMSVTKTTTDIDLRNRVVVYGAQGIYAEAKASSPYLPSGYYKTAVLSTPIIDLQSSADTAAEFNLDTWNRLRTSLGVEAEGLPGIVAHDVITVQQTDLAINDDWYVYSANHTMDEKGYFTQLELRQ